MALENPQTPTDPPQPTQAEPPAAPGPSESEPAPGPGARLVVKTLSEHEERLRRVEAATGEENPSPAKTAGRESGGALCDWLTVL